MTTEFIIKDEVMRDAAIIFLRGLNLSKPWRLEIKRHQKRRSLSQNALLHKWFDTIGQETGNSPEDVKEAYREMFLGKVPMMLGDEERMVGRSTAGLETSEMSNFMDQVYNHATTELGILLPLPEEQHLSAGSAA